MKDSLDKGRVLQKRRTRAALLEAAAELMKDGATPTVAEAAEAAMVSRATAYRYFPTQESLLIEVPIEIAMPTVEDLFGADPDKPADAEDRIDLVEKAVHKVCYQTEPQIRVYLRTSMDRWFAKKQKKMAYVPLRQARRMQLIEAALRPIRDKLEKSRYETLCAALTLVIGLESLIALTDVVQLDRTKARRVKSWAVRALVRAALDDLSWKNNKR